MSAGNQNKYGLDELEFIQGDVPFNKVSAWDKLQDRLGEKKPNNNKWYLAAASVIILLSAGMMIWNLKESDEVIKNGVVKNDGSKKDAGMNRSVSSTGTLHTPTQIDDKSEITEQKNSPIKKFPDKKIITENKTSNSKKVNFPENKSGDKFSQQTNSFAGLHTEPSPIFSKSPDVLNIISPEIPQNQTAARLQPVKTKLKVLHHNQLQNTLPVTHPAYSARSGSIQGTTVFGRNKSDDFIKIKITTSN